MIRKTGRISRLYLNARVILIVATVNPTFETVSEGTRRVRQGERVGLPATAGLLGRLFDRARSLFISGRLALTNTRLISGLVMNLVACLSLPGILTVASDRHILILRRRILEQDDLICAWLVHIMIRRKYVSRSNMQCRRSLLARLLVSERRLQTRRGATCRRFIHKELINLVECMVRLRDNGSGRHC
ncbi:MAG: hypothetical protein JOS17DRAFT_731188 [Linnemannia elongata]|nr:MAG: hypothetical protein JOS17DRAFT_731188 [Linnemannia elongata]